MEITGLGTSASARGAAEAVPQSDFNTFLIMLTVQMRNQDPLNPMDASDFAAQLATFSAVEQQTYTNQLLGAMLNRSGLADLGAWVGMEARLFSGAHFDGAPISLAPDPALGADSVTLVVRNAAGAVVDSRTLATDAQSYVWDGTGTDGQPVPTGTYTFELVSSRRGDVLSTQPVAAYQRILEARQDGATTLLVLPGHRYVDSSTVTGLRRPAT